MYRHEKVPTSSAIHLAVVVGTVYHPRFFSMTSEYFIHIDKWKWLKGEAEYIKFKITYPLRFLDYPSLPLIMLLKQNYSYSTCLYLFFYIDVLKYNDYLRLCIRITACGRIRS